MPELLLPDVSEYQPDVQWKDVVAPKGGAAIIRANYSADHVDAAWQYADSVAWNGIGSCDSSRMRGR